MLVIKLIAAVFALINLGAVIVGLKEGDKEGIVIGCVGLAGAALILPA